MIPLARNFYKSKRQTKEIREARQGEHPPPRGNGLLLPALDRLRMAVERELLTEDFQQGNTLWDEEKRR
jgi:hypothetical protein